MNFIPPHNNILELATTIIEAYGNGAMRQAAIYAYKCDTVKDIDGSKTWDLVMHAIVELNRTPRSESESCD